MYLSSHWTRLSKYYRILITIFSSTFWIYQPLPVILRMIKRKQKREKLFALYCVKYFTVKISSHLLCQIFNFFTQKKKTDKRHFRTKNLKKEGQRVVSVVKSNRYSFWEPGFDSQHWHCSLQLPVTLVLLNPCPLLASTGMRHTIGAQTYLQAICLYTQKLIIKKQNK